MRRMPSESFALDIDSDGDLTILIIQPGFWPRSDKRQVK